MFPRVMLARFVVASLLAVSLLAPLSSAEFGPETPDGWPINVDGVVIKPPVAGVSVVPDQPLNKAGPVTAYPYYPLLTAEVQRLAMDYPGLVKLSSAGKSVAGLDVWLLEIADFDNPDMLPLEDRERLYVDGGTHSNEYSGVYFVTELAQFLLDEYDSNETAKWIVQNRHTFIVPLVNPDGSNVFGRLNVNTVNINRNFPGTWGTVDEDPVMNNPGPQPESEPETRVVTALMDQIQPDYVNSIHCCGNLWLHPYGAEQLENPADLQMYTRICDEAFASVREYCGEIWSTIYPASGTTADEGYERVGASSWTYEMSGRGAVAPWGQPVITEDPRVQEYESWDGIMHAFLHVEKYGARPEIRDIRGNAGSLTVTIENVGYGNLTHGNLTLGDATLALPFLAPDETTTLTFEGAFAAGDLAVGIDWVKRERHMTPGSRDLVVSLLDTPDGLVGALGTQSEDVFPAAADIENPVPAPAPVIVALLVLGVALAMRRR